MNIILDTGILSNESGSITSSSGTTIDNSPSERIIYPQSRQQHLLVEPGSMAVVTSYTNDCSNIIVEKILLSNGVPATAKGNGCCLTLKDGAETTILNRVAIPAYTMNKDNPVRVIDIPGVYSISPENDIEGLITITATEYKLQHQGPKVPEVRCDCNICDTAEVPELEE